MPDVVVVDFPLGCIQRIAFGPGKANTGWPGILDAVGVRMGPCGRWLGGTPARQLHRFKACRLGNDSLFSVLSC